MRREISLWVEWTWAQGLLQGDAHNDEIESWARALTHSLSRSDPRHFGSHEEASLQIAAQIRRSLSALSYGQRKPSELHPKRLEHLERHFQSVAVRALPNFVTQLS